MERKRWTRLRGKSGGLISSGGKRANVGGAWRGGGGGEGEGGDVNGPSVFGGPGGLPGDAASRGIS